MATLTDKKLWFYDDSVSSCMHMYIQELSIFLALKKSDVSLKVCAVLTHYLLTLQVLWDSGHTRVNLSELLFMQKGLCTKKAQFRYYEFQKVRRNGFVSRRRVDGTFMEEIELDIENGAFERISVPPILDSRRSTVLHDFETVNLTRILYAVWESRC